MERRYISEEYKRQKAAEYIAYSKIKNQGYIVKLREELNEDVSLVAKWAREYSVCQLPHVEVTKEFIKPVKTKKTFICAKCGAEFEADVFRKYCSNGCRKTFRCWDSKSSICFNCVNYEGCRKFGSLQVQDRMIDFDKTDQKLKVYDCKDFVTRDKLTEKQLILRNKALINKTPIMFIKKETV